MLGKTLLLDTNILVSYLLDQNDYESSEKLFEKILDLNIPVVISDFAIFSLSIILLKRNENTFFKKIIEFLKNQKNFRIYKTTLDDLEEIANLKAKLDFDDKLHYFLAKKKNLQFISYDKDFDKTDLKRFTPKEIISYL